MRTKSYWNKSDGGADPFELPKRIAKGLEDCKETAANAEDASRLRYLWIYVTESGLRKDSNSPEPHDRLGLEGWLNVIDESASLGAQWMVVYVGASLSQVPYIWRMCEWAQDVHGLRVGLHLTSNCLSEDDIEHLTRLESDKTYLIADKKHIASLRYLEASGLHLSEANIRPSERAKHCTKPEEIACVGTDGRLFSCGLVLGDERFEMGDAQDRTLRDVMEDQSLPHEVPDTTAFSSEGCNACPPLLAHRALEKELL